MRINTKPNWIRNDRERWYLAAIILLSIALTLFTSHLFFTKVFIEGSSFFRYVLFSLSILLYPVPVLPHLPAFVYARYTRDSSRDIPGKTESYFMAFLAAIAISFAVTMRVGMVMGLPPALPFWQIDVLFTAGVLLIPAFHSYCQYDEYEDFRRVVLLVMVYAPWTWIVRLAEVHILW